MAMLFESKILIGVTSKLRMVGSKNQMPLVLAEPYVSRVGIYNDSW